MSRTARWLLTAAALAIAACSGSSEYPQPWEEKIIPPDGHRPQGQSSFETPTNGNGAQRGGYDTAEGAKDANAAPSAAAPATQQRTVEESDIYKIEGNHLFVLNRYRGLQILDISNLDAPRLVGRAPIYGYPKDMYVREGRAYIIVSDYWSYWRNTSEDSYVEPFYGSQLRIVDLTDVQNPSIVGAINLEGDCGDSRIVGQVMYLVSHRYPWWSYSGSSDTQDQTTVLSVDISNPANVHVVDSESFPRNGWDHHVFVDSQAIYLSASGWSGNTWPYDYRTTVRYIDISDPHGTIRVRGGAEVTGRVADRWALDVFNRVLRVASGQSWGNGDIHLTTFSVANPDSIVQLGQTTLHVNEQLKSARFDGNRGYLVSFRQVDPLFAFDLSDPAHPTLLGELEMSGWLDFMVPQGDRVVALGHDEVVGPNGQTQWSLAVSLIDVSTQQPALLSRVTIDGAWGWVPAENDDFAKVFRILPEANLIVFPFSSWDPQTWRHLGGVQLIDFFPDRLAKRGVIGNAGWVERGVVHGVDTVLTLSSEVFQVMDIADRDQPQLRGRLELARNVLDFAVLNGTHTAQLGGDWYRGDTSLTITPIDDPDTASPVASIHVPAPYGRLFQNGQLAYITSVEQTPATSTTSASSVTRIKVVDLTNPAAPVERGSMTLPEAIWGSYGYWYWGYGDEVVQVNGSTLAFHHYAYDYGWYDCYGCSGRDGGDWAHRIYLVDLSDPDQPRLASTVVLDDMRWAWGLRAQGNSLLMSAYDSVQHGQQWYARYHLRQIDLTDLDHPMARAPVSIPGWLVGTSPSGPYVFTLESWWDAVNQKSRTTLHALELYDGVAYLQSSTEVDGYLNGVEVVGDTAFGVVSSSWQESVNGSTAYRSRSDLVTYDLSTPQNIHRAGQVQVPDSWGWLRRVAGGRAFVVGGAGVFAFRIDDPSQPTFDQFFRTYGWVQDVVVHGNKAFLPSGYYGVQVVDLNTP